MPDDANLGRIKKLNISVGEDGTIRTQILPEILRIRDYKLNLDLKIGSNLRLRTIIFLINSLRKGELPIPEGRQLLGEYLYSVLLDNEIGEVITKSIFFDEDTELLRVELEFEQSIQGIDLSSWPWECLYCPEKPEIVGGGYSLTTATRLVLARHLSLNLCRPLTVETKDLPVRLLLVVTSPDGLSAVICDKLLEDLEALQQDLGDNKLLLKPLIDHHTSSFEDQEDANVNATFWTFLDYVEDFKPHVIHFIGHGEYQEGQGGRIAFMNIDRKPHWVSDQLLSEKLAGCRDLRLVFLQACESALPGTYQTYQAISGCAQLLAHKAIPAIVGMQYQVGKQEANVFARTFYRQLANSKPIDIAVLKARGEIEKDMKGHLPVLYLNLLHDTMEPYLFPPLEKSQVVPADRCPTTDKQGRYRRERHSTSL